MYNPFGNAAFGKSGFHFNRMEPQGQMGNITITGGITMNGMQGVDGFARTLNREIKTYGVQVQTRH